LESIQASKTILGICFGAQLIADVLGARVYPNKEQEIGWFPVTLNIRNLPSELRLLPPEITAFHWHGDTFDLPEGSVLISSSEVTPNQAFLYKKNVLALQYHFEVDERAVKLMIEHAGYGLTNGQYIQSSEEILHGIDHVESNNKIMYNILNYLEQTTKRKISV
jgi:GMP synthase (glutamine-hydrolysing)